MVYSVSLEFDGFIVAFRSSRQNLIADHFFYFTKGVSRIAGNDTMYLLLPV